MHMPAFSTITTAGIYLAAPPTTSFSSPHTQPPTTLSGSASSVCQGGASGARHSNIRKSETCLHQASFKITHTHKHAKHYQQWCKIMCMQLRRVCTCRQTSCSYFFHHLFHLFFFFFMPSVPDQFQTEAIPRGNTEYEREKIVFLFKGMNHKHTFVIKYFKDVTASFTSSSII